MKIESLQKQLLQFKKEHRLRKITCKDSNLVNFSSNDYLQLAKRKDLRQQFYSLHPDLALSSSSSRLIDGSYEEVMLLEASAERIYQKPALCFNSGFDANASLIETLFNKESLILTDRLNHASIYDGILSSKAKFLRYPHLQIEKLEQLLEKYHDRYEDILIVSESIYSMDGDCADLKALVELKKKYKCQLMIDEAHSYGVHSYGICYQEGLVEDVDFLVLPLGKGGASMGAILLCSALHKEYLINCSRRFIYSTALAPVNHAWNRFLLEAMPSFDKERANLEARQQEIYQLLQDAKIPVQSTTHILSILIGDNDKATRLAEALVKKGFLVQAIREPTVPKGSARLRLSLHAALTKENIENFVKELAYEMHLLV